MASTEGLSSRLLSMRDSAFATLGDDAPAFTVDSVTPSDREGIATEVRGHLRGAAVPRRRRRARQLARARTPTACPTQTGTYTANFTCVVPDVGLRRPTRPAPASTRHGLLGTSDQVPGGSGDVAAAGNIVFCGTDLIGMAEEDTGNAVAIIGDLSTFHTLSDRLLQGHLNTLFLGRLLIHPDGLGTDPAFQDGGTSLLTDDLVYYGISQGGIMGGATTAVAQDFTRAVLDVPAANYGLLLDRSVDFDPFRAVLDPAYPSPADRALGLQLIQMLWDSRRGQRLPAAPHRRPYADTPEHEVLLHVALGDHQVANIATEVQARTLGIPVHRPVMADDRSTAVEPWFGIDTLEYPYEGSAVLMWDSGAELPPDTNQPAARRATTRTATPATPRRPSSRSSPSSPPARSSTSAATPPASASPTTDRRPTPPNRVVLDVVHARTAVRVETHADRVARRCGRPTRELGDVVGPLGGVVAEHELRAGCLERKEHVEGAQLLLAVVTEQGELRGLERLPEVAGVAGEEELALGRCGRAATGGRPCDPASGCRRPSRRRRGRARRRRGARPARCRSRPAGSAAP